MDKEPRVRRVWRLKGGSYIVSLPKEWVEKHKLEEVLVLAEHNGSLKLLPKTLYDKKEAVIDLTKIKDPVVATYHILTSYMQGFDRIKIVSETPMDAQTKKKLRDLRSEMIGADILEERSDLLIYEILLDVSQQSVNETIKRFNDFIDGIHIDTVKSIENFDKRVAEEILGRIKDGLKKYRYLIRQIAVASRNPLISEKIGILDNRQAIVYGTVAAYLNRMLHHTAAPNQYLLKLNEEDVVAKDYVLKIAEIAYKTRNNSVSAFINKDLDFATKAMKFMVIVRNLEEELLNYFSTGKISVNAAIVYSMMSKEFRRVCGFSVGVADALANLLLAP